MRLDESDGVERGLVSHDDRVVEERGLVSRDAFVVEEKDPVSRDAFVVEEKDPVSRDEFVVEEKDPVSRDEFVVFQNRLCRRACVSGLAAHRRRRPLSMLSLCELETRPLSWDRAPPH